MSKLRNMLSAAVMCMALAACATTGTTSPPGTPPPATGAQSDATKAAVAILTVYADLYQPAVLFYGRLPDCPGATLCKQRSVLTQLQKVDKTASAAIAIARPIIAGGAASSGSEIQTAVQAVMDAEALIAQTGAFAMLKGSTP